jgi:hypothetical protein
LVIAMSISSPQPPVIATSEFVRLQIATLVSVLSGATQAYFGSQPNSGGGLKLALRVNGTTVCTVVEWAFPAELMATKIRVIDQAAAREIIAAITDRRLNEILGNGIGTRNELRAIKFRSKNVPTMFDWVQTRGGRHLIWALTAEHMPIWGLGEWHELAAHPSAYGAIWRVVEDHRREFVGGRLYFDCLPSMERWALLQTTDALMWATLKPSAKKSASAILRAASQHNRTDAAQ